MRFRKPRNPVPKQLIDVLAPIFYSHLARQPKIFGIGLSRTGTKSLTLGLERLGYRCCHFPMFMLELENGCLAPDFEKVKYFKGLTDTPVAAFYQELDLRFPGSLFVLTTRDTDDWLASCRKFFRAGRWNGLPKFHALHDRLYGGSQFDPERFAQAYRSHVNGVRRYFHGRRYDLLEIDITSGEGFEKLCPFLGRPILNETFPKTHVSRRR